jgi:DNA-binding protein
MAKKEMNNLVIIGRKPMAEYSTAVLLAFEDHRTVLLSSVGLNVEKAERLVYLFTNIGVKLEHREKKDYKDGLKATIFTLVNVNGKKTDG